MKTYRIEGKTNGWIASRDIHFNGKTTIVLAENLTHEEAIKKLNEFFYNDYEFAIEINSPEEYAKEMYAGLIQDLAHNTGLTVEIYFAKTKKRWLKYSQLNADLFRKFTEPGIYNEGVFMKKTDGENYDFDSRFYGIVEENEEN